MAASFVFFVIRLKNETIVVIELASDGSCRIFLGFKDSNLPWGSAIPLAEFSQDFDPIRGLFYHVMQLVNPL